MTAGDDVLAVALGCVGEQETGSNQIRFAAELGISGQAWCAAFVSSCYTASGHPLGAIDCPGGFVYVPAGVDNARRLGEAIEVGGMAPQPGDVVFYCWDGVRWAEGHLQVGNHTGIVAAWQPGWVTAVEGNTSPGSSGSQDNGEGVWVRERPEALVACYWRPGALGQGGNTVANGKRVDVAVLGTDGRAYHQADIEGQGLWTGWAPLGPLQPEAAPTMAWHGNFLHFFAVERGSGRVMQRSWDDSLHDWVFGGTWYEVAGGGRGAPGSSVSVLVH